MVGMKKFQNHPWTISIGSTIIGILFTMFIDWIKGIQVWSTLKGVFIFLYNTLITLMNYELKVWWVLLAVIVVVVAFIAVLKIRRKIEANRFRCPDFWGEYTSDTLQGVHWEWYWEKDSLGDRRLEGLTPICPKCKTPMSQSYMLNMNLVCPRCGFEHEKELPDIEQIETLILDNVKRRMLAYAEHMPQAGNKK